jgi:hypothetical protein
MFYVPEFIIKIEHPCPLLWFLRPPPLDDILIESGMVDPKFLKSERSIPQCGLEVRFKLD